MVSDNASQLLAENVYVAFLSPEKTTFFSITAVPKNRHLGGKRILQPDL